MAEDGLDLDSFLIDVDFDIQEVKQTFLDSFQRNVVFELFVELITLSPVLTGRYRAEHVILADNLLIFEHPQRVGPTGKPIPTNIIPPPDGSAIESAVRNIQLGQSVTFSNDIFYAEDVERRHSVYSKLGVESDHILNSAAKSVTFRS